MRAHRDLTTASGGAIACAVLALALPWQPLQVIAAVPLALLLPGYAVAAAAFGRRLPHGSMLLMLAVALSLSVLALAPLVLHFAPGGIRAGSWAILLTLVVVGCCAVAARRRPAPSPSKPSRTLLGPLPGLGRVDLVLLGAGAVAIGAVVVLSSTLLPASNALGYTRLWMLPSVTDARVPHVRIGVVSEEQDPIAYRLVIEAGERTTERAFALAPGERHIVRIRARGGQPRDVPIPVTARLYTPEDPETAYRRVDGWIPSG